MVRQGDQEWARLLSNAIRPGNRRIRAPNHHTGPASEQREQRIEREIAELSDGAPLQKHRHQIAMIALRRAAPVSAGFGPERVGFVPAIAASSTRTSSTKPSTSLKASQ